VKNTLNAKYSAPIPTRRRTNWIVPDVALLTFTQFGCPLRASRIFSSSGQLSQILHKHSDAGPIQM
jgi:hypothetical protein